MKEIEVEGKNVEEAIRAGLAKYGLKREEVEVRILNEGKSGLFGLMGANPAKVKLILLEEIKEKDYKALEKKVLTTLEKILELINIKGEIKISVFGGRILVEILTEDGTILIGKRGQILDSLTFITNLIVSKEEKTSVKIDIDVNNYKAERKDKFQDMARRVAEDVKNDGKTRELKPASSFERKYIHMALEHDGEIETFSKGMGESRRVVIALKSKKEFK